MQEEERFLTCTGRRFRRSESGRKSRPASFGMTVVGVRSDGQAAKRAQQGEERWRDKLAATPPLAGFAAKALTELGPAPTLTA